MKFTYKATTKDGRIIAGSAEAASKQALIGMLHKQEVQPIVIEVDKRKHQLGNLFGPKKKVKLSDLVIFTRQLSTMVGAGVPLARCLSGLQSDAANPYMREVLGSVTKDVESGIPLGDAFAKFPNVFSDVYVNMVRAGEEGGILDEILKRLATQVEQDASMRKKIISAMMYPAVILSVTVIAFFGIMLFIVPKLGNILTSLGGPNAQLPIYTRILLGVSNFCSKPTIMEHTHLPLLSKIPNLVLIIIAMVVAFIYIMRYIRTPRGRYKFDGLLLRIPIVKTVVLKIAIARFSRIFASLMSAGVSVLDALEVTGAALGNKVIEAELKKAAEAVTNGQQLSQPISQSKYLSLIHI